MSLKTKAKAKNFAVKAKAEVKDLHFRNTRSESILSSILVWTHEQSTVAENPHYRCRGGWAAKGLLKQVMEYFKINLLSPKAKAKAKDLSFKAKAKDMPYCP